MVIGTTLRLPGEFYLNTNQEIQDSSEYVQKLQQMFHQIQPRMRTARRKGDIFIHPDLHSALTVYLRIGRVCKPLEPPYEEKIVPLNDQQVRGRCQS